MNEQMIRELDALGYRPISIRRIGKATLISLQHLNDKGSWLFVPGVFGPSWPNILKTLSSQGRIVEPLLLAGRYTILMTDGNDPENAVRECLKSIRMYRKFEIFVPGIGFTTTSIKRSLNWRAFVGPAIALAVLPLIYFLFPLDSSELEKDIEEIDFQQQVSCVIDEGNVVRWIEQLLAKSEITELPEVFTSKDSKGELTISKLQMIGSQVLANADIACENGNREDFTLRLDQSGKGPVSIVLEN
jgi:hypothetical protein